MMVLDSMASQTWYKEALEALKSVFAQERVLENETPLDSETAPLRR